MLKPFSRESEIRKKKTAGEESEKTQKNYPRKL